jgi:hypothetical protein
MLEDALLKGFVPQLKAALRKQLKKQGAGISSGAVLGEGAEGRTGSDDGGGESSGVLGVDFMRRREGECCW